MVSFFNWILNLPFLSNPKVWLIFPKQSFVCSSRSNFQSVLQLNLVIEVTGLCALQRRALHPKCAILLILLVSRLAFNLKKSSFTFVCFKLYYSIIMTYFNWLKLRFYFTGAFCFICNAHIVLCFWQCFYGTFNFYGKHYNKVWDCLWVICFSVWPYTCLLFSFHLLTYPGFYICLLYFQLSMWE